MSVWELLEQLITEHGSAAILRERVAAHREEFERLTAQREELRAQVATLTSELASLKQANAALDAKHEESQQQRAELQLENRRLSAQVEHLEELLSAPPDGNPKRHCCHHCGSQRLKRTGSRPNPMFHEVGIRDVLYTCDDCGKESHFMRDEP